MNLHDYAKEWQDTPEYHSFIHETFIDLVNDNPKLKAHRDFVESNAHGFGERSFGWLYKLMVDEMPKEFSFLEIGIFRGNSLSLFKLLADMAGKKIKRFGVSPMDSSDGHWESDYFYDAAHIHQVFNLKKDYLIYHGSSTKDEIIQRAGSTAPYDIVYIDGCHEYDYVVSDLDHYAPMVKQGGYLLIDDACNDLKMKFGYFQGIDPVTKAVLEWENDEFEFVFNVVHNRLYRRK
jgi:cephalosporin hydroxylase